MRCPVHWEDPWKCKPRCKVLRRKLGRINSLYLMHWKDRERYPPMYLAEYTARFGRFNAK